MDAKKLAEYITFAAGPVDPDHANTKYRALLLEFRSPDTLIIVGTDGRRAAVARVTGPHLMGDAEMAVCYAAALGPAVAATLCGDVTPVDGMLMDNAGNVVPLDVVAGAERLDWRRAMPGALPGPDLVRVDPALLAEAAAAFGGRPITIEPGNSGVSTPCLDMQAEGGALRYVLAGVRV